ncbi:MAG: cold shock domain-containing protein [Saprospiraceae bacterium]|nr:cold shock domain-containing protein [Saprospiraceae bacterium]
MQTGTVKMFNEAKGFGFIVDNSSKEEIFVHVTGLIDNIREGDQVTFNTERGRKGMNAVDVKLAG